ARYDFYGRGAVRILALVPLLLTPFVNAFVVKKVLDPRAGLINWLFHDTLKILPFRVWVDGLAAVALTQIVTFYPIVMLNVYAALMNIDPTMEEQAENLGARGFMLFRKVTLPLALPGLAAGATLVFIFSLEDLGAPIVFHGHPLARKLMSFQIYSSFISETGQRSPEIAALSVILLAIAVSGFLIIRKYVSLRMYAMVSRGGRWKPRISKLGVAGHAIVYSFLVPLLLLTSLPQLGVFALALSSKWVGTFPEGFTVKNMAEVLLNPRVSRFVVNSLTYSAAAMGLIAVLGLMAAYAASRLRIPGISLLDALATMPIAMPGIVVAMGYFYFFSQVFSGTILDPINIVAFNPGPLLVIGYAVRRMPFAVRSIFAGIQQVHVNLEEAAFNLGARRFKTVRSVVLPLIALNVLGGVLVSFIYCMGEVSLSIIIGTLNVERAPIT
ncbi:MAG TPA: iron ABC transporter permease, partial [Armatimonadetes bacterium]|nr:iron ABC transporter permease [Armatimonadota bacterium]